VIKVDLLEHLSFVFLFRNGDFSFILGITHCWDVVEHVKDMKNTTTTWTKQQSWQTDRETERAIIQCAS
jgi:hypothetical protein